MVVILAAVGCQIEDPAQADLDRLIEAVCDQNEACACAGSQKATACEIRRTTWNDRLAYARREQLLFNASCIDQTIGRARAQGCSDYRNNDDPCHQFCSVFHGSAKLGAACTAFDTATSDCANGLSCLDGTCVQACAGQHGLPEGRTCRDGSGNEIESCLPHLTCSANSGRCEAGPGLGESCELAGCSPDTWCDDDLLCHARAQPGESCENVPCAPGSLCSGVTDRTCVDTAGEGEPCSTGLCDDGLSCDLKRNVCAPKPREGETCDGLSCASGLYCDGDDVCRSRAEPGAPCGHEGCGGGLWCESSTETCQVPPDTAGQACLEGQCAGDVRCDADTDRCVPYPSEGEPCPQRRCSAGLWCDDGDDPEGVCTATGEAGDACSGHIQCASRYCPAGFCVDPPREGDSCAEADVCTNGLVCDGAVCFRAVTEGPAVCSYVGW